MRTFADMDFFTLLYLLKLSPGLFLCWAWQSVINYFLKGCQTSKCQMCWTAAHCCNRLKKPKWNQFLVLFMDKSMWHQYIIPIYCCIAYVLNNIPKPAVCQQPSCRDLSSHSATRASVKSDTDVEDCWTWLCAQVLDPISKAGGAL